jgi:hypothetical protein
MLIEIERFEARDWSPFTGTEVARGPSRRPLALRVPADLTGEPEHPVEARRSRKRGGELTGLTNPASVALSAFSEVNGIYGAVRVSAVRRCERGRGGLTIDPRPPSSRRRLDRDGGEGTQDQDRRERGNGDNGEGFAERTAAD